MALRQRSNGWLSTQETDIQKKIKNIFALMNICAARMTGNLQAKEVPGTTHVFNCKPRMEKILGFQDSRFMRASNENIINVNEESQKRNDNRLDEKTRIKVRQLKS